VVLSPAIVAHVDFEHLRPIDLIYAVAGLVAVPNARHDPAPVLETA
jgi:hypothetical protein